MIDIVVAKWLSYKLAVITLVLSTFTDDDVIWFLISLFSVAVIVKVPVKMSWPSEVSTVSK